MGCWVYVPASCRLLRLGVFRWGLNMHLPTSLLWPRAQSTRSTRLEISCVLPRSLVSGYCLLGEAVEAGAVLGAGVEHVAARELVDFELFGERGGKLVLREHRAHEGAR